MARNEEKQYGRLNRMILQKQKEEYRRLHPKRPNLNAMHTVDEIKAWLPNIKEEIDFNLKQSQVVCYSDQKVSELQANVVHLEHEYKRFVRKMMQIDSSLTSVPWTNRPYEPKRARLSVPSETQDQVHLLRSDTARITTPILDGEVPRCSVAPSNFSHNVELQDAPLQFESAHSTKAHEAERENCSGVSAPCGSSGNLPPGSASVTGNVLNLNYSSSSDDDV